MIVNTDTGEILSPTYPLRYKPRGRVEPSKRTFTQTRPEIHLTNTEAWVAGLLTFCLGVWFAH